MFRLRLSYCLFDANISFINLLMIGVSRNVACNITEELDCVTLIRTIYTHISVVVLTGQCL